MLSKAKLQYLRSLSQKKIREREGVFLIEGWHSIEEASRALKEIPSIVYPKAAAETDRFAAIFSAARRISRERIEVSSKELSQIADTVAAQGIVAVVKKLSSDPGKVISDIDKRGGAFVLALDGLSDPGNLGAIVRACDWFGVDAVYLSGSCVELYNPKVVRSTAGSLFHLPIFESPPGSEFFSKSLVELRSRGFALIGAEVAGSTDVRSLTWPEKSVLAIGNESHGLSPEVSMLLDSHVAIPRFGKAESLNAGIAAGVLIAHHALQSRR